MRRMSSEEENYDEFAQEQSFPLEDNQEEAAGDDAQEEVIEEENEPLQSSENNIDEDGIEQDPDRLPSSSDGPIIKRMKRPPSKWILYLGEQRKILSETQPEITFAEQTKVIAQTYKLLPPEEHTRLDEIVKTLTENYRNSRSNEPATSSNSKREIDDSPAALQFPLARVRKTMKMDPEVKNVNRDAVALVTKAAELFVARMALKCRATSAMRGAKSINGNDVIHTIHSDYAMEFLRWDFPKSFLQTPTTKKSHKEKAATIEGNVDETAGEVDGVIGQSTTEKRSVGRGKGSKKTTASTTVSSKGATDTSTRPKTTMHSFFQSAVNNDSSGSGISIAKKRNLDEEDEEVDEAEELEEVTAVPQGGEEDEYKRGKNDAFHDNIQLPHTVALEQFEDDEEEDVGRTAEVMGGEEETQLDGNNFE